MGIAFQNDGSLAVSGGMDSFGRVWDLRKRNIEYTIPGHTKLVSNVSFEKTSGEYVLTSSYDATAKLWAAKTWQPLATLTGHDSRLMGCDISPNGDWIATCSYDRTFRLYAPDI